MAMSVKALILATIFISMFSLGFLSLISETTSNYNVQISAPYNQTTDTINTGLGEFKTFSKGIEGNTSASEVSSTELGLVKIGPIFSATKLIFNIPGIIMKILTGLSSNLGLPEWLLSGIMVMLIIFIVFALIKIIFKTEL